MLSLKLLFNGEVECLNVGMSCSQVSIVGGMYELPCPSTVRRCRCDQIEKRSSVSGTTRCFQVWSLISGRSRPSLVTTNLLGWPKSRGGFAYQVSGILVPGMSSMLSSPATGILSPASMMKSAEDVDRRSDWSRGHSCNFSTSSEDRLVYANITYASARTTVSQTLISVATCPVGRMYRRSSRATSPAFLLLVEISATKFSKRRSLLPNGAGHRRRPCTDSDAPWPMYHARIPWTGQQSSKRQSACEKVVRGSHLPPQRRT